MAVVAGGKEVKLVYRGLRVAMGLSTGIWDASEVCETGTLMRVLQLVAGVQCVYLAAVCILGIPLFTRCPQPI